MAANDPVGRLDMMDADTIEGLNGLDSGSLDALAEKKAELLAIAAKEEGLLALDEKGAELLALAAKSEELLALLDSGGE